MEWGCSNAFFISFGTPRIHGRSKLLYVVLGRHNLCTLTVAAKVILVLVLESAQMGASFGNIYDWLIKQFGNWDALRYIRCTYLSIFVAQAHFARCIYHLQKQNIILPAIIFLLALVAVGQVVQCIKLGEYAKLGATKVTSNVQAGTAIAADILITFGLCWRLNQERGGIQSTNKILNFLIMTAINRGGFTVIFAALNIILVCSTCPELTLRINSFFSFSAAQEPSTLCLLNTRQYAAHVGQTTVVQSSLSVPVLEAAPRFTNNTNGITVSTTQQTHIDEALSTFQEKYAV
ncbi:hypothetical protein GGX14DRAFT_466394 [Mycena pura]|uniref:DUF6534 domain-containing protein n=1 Tax=Mycena pura TaxID=153505 RepID=A0AAD6V2K5_9AGAR|nr:hypothetical protein GGX14DRAFT_466394 [Mycena pura]